MARAALLLGGLTALLQIPALMAQAAAVSPTLRIDFQRTNGVIRPLHGVNAGPLCYRGTVDLTAYHRELGIPLTRLHDVPWVNAEAVDIHLVFPDFRNDPKRADSYQFAPTDDYIRAITNVPSQIVYRLGESIEHTPRQYHVHPPSDPEKWAAICLGIIRHYNHGWAEGFQHHIQFWEIWNEPDVRPSMWTGTDEEYFHLYEVTAKAIKAEFPEVKVGGPAVGGPGAFQGEVFKASGFVTRFLAYCRQHQAPLDFFSWHRYTSRPAELPRYAQAIRAFLDQNGFARTESHLNEWNYLPNDDWAPLVRQGQGILRERWHEQMSGPAGAAFAAAGLILLQDAPLDAANFYTGEVQGFGLFNFSGVPKSSYYAFKAFREMLNTPRRVSAQGEMEGKLAALAGVDSDEKHAAVLVSHWTGPEEQFSLLLQHRPWPGLTSYQVLLVDEAHQLTETGRGTLSEKQESIQLQLRAPCVALIRLAPALASPQRAP